MQIGTCLMPDVDEVTFFAFAEHLGYDSVWVTDSRMLSRTATPPSRSPLG